MKKVTIFMVMIIIFLSNVAYAERVDMEYPSYLPINEDVVNYDLDCFVVRGSDGRIRMFSNNKNYPEDRPRLRLEDDGQNLYLSVGYPDCLYHDELKNGEWVKNWYDSNTMKIYGFEILYTNYELVDSTTGEVFFPIIPPTLQEITGESVEKIPAGMVGMMRTIFPVGFGILLGIVLARSLKVLYHYF